MIRFRAGDVARVTGRFAAAQNLVPVRTAALLHDHANRMNARIIAGAPSRRVAASATVDVSKGGMAVEFGPTHPLSHLFEFGTGPRFQKTTGRYTGVMSPRPFVGPVVSEGIPALVADARRTLRP